MALRPRSACLVLGLCLSVITLLLQALWIPPEISRPESAGWSPEELGHQGAPQGGGSVRRLALRLEALSSQVQRLARDRDGPQPIREDLGLQLQSLRQDQEGLVRSVQRELQRMARKLDHLGHHFPHTPRPQTNQRPHTPRPQTNQPPHTPRPQTNQPPHTPPPQTNQQAQTGVPDKCDVPVDQAYPLCAEKVQFLREHWQSDPCYAFYGVDGTICSILLYLSQREDFCPPRHGTNHSALPWQQPPHSPPAMAEIRTTLSPLYEVIGRSAGPAARFMQSRVERLSGRWIQTGVRMRHDTARTSSPQRRVLLYPGMLSGPLGQRLGATVDRGGPLGELVQWADLSACLFILGHNLTFTTDQQHLHRLIGAAPGGGSCPIQRPLTFDLVYTDYHGLAQLQGAMGLAFQHYQCRFRVLDSFGTDPAFNLASYARRHGYHTLWGSWGLRPLQYMTMFPHSPDNSFLGFVSEEAEPEQTRKRKDNMALVYGKQEYMWQGKERYLELISAEMETHGTVYQPPSPSSSSSFSSSLSSSSSSSSPSSPSSSSSSSSSSPLPSSVINHGLLAQDQFLQLLRRAKVFVGLGFPYEGPAPLEAISLGCVFLQPRFSPPLTAQHSPFYRGKPTSREVTSQHPYAEHFIGRPYVWTVDITNSTEVQQTLRAILHTQVKPFTPREFTCEGMLQRVNAYITHQDFCLASPPAWPPEGALRALLGPLGQSCVGVCRRAALVCEPALFHHLNSPAAFSRLGLDCSSTDEEVDHLLPAYSPWGRVCGLQKERLLFSCAGSGPALRRLCPCRAHLAGQVALCPDCL